MENVNGTVKVIGALVVGSLIGAALGVLFAPEKGVRTRRNIKNGIKDLSDDIIKRIKDEASDLREKASDLEDLAKEKFEEMSKHTKQDLKDLQNAARQPQK